jgi:CHAD domain-containing protein
VTLRHRSGESAGEDGWHLKLPVREGRVPDASIGARDELHADGDPDVIPPALRELVTPWARTAVLGPVATLATERSTWLLRDNDGAAAVVLTDDLVSVLSSGHVAGRFREIEVEDRGGGTDAIAAVGGALRAAGAVGGQFVPKVVRALGPQATADPDPPLPEPVAPDEPAYVEIREILRRYVRALLGNDIAVRRDAPDAVHQMRVTARRLRSALATFQPLLDPEWAGSLRTELKWLGESIAGARDNEVLLERLTASLAELPPELVVGPVQTRLAKDFGAKLAAGQEAARDVLRSQRYVVLLERLADAAWEPLTSPAADEPIATVIPAAVQAAWDKLEKRVARLSASDATDHDWHRARIQAKAVRYACTAVQPVFGKPAKRLANRAEAVQEVLGEHQDAVVAAAALRTMAVARGAGSVAFTLGVLHSRQAAAGVAARVAFADVWAKAKAPKHRRWLTT